MSLLFQDESGRTRTDHGIRKKKKRIYIVDRKTPNQLSITVLFARSYGKKTRLTVYIEYTIWEKGKEKKLTEDI